MGDLDQARGLVERGESPGPGRMMREAQLSGAWTQLIARGLESLEVDVRALCERVGVTYAALVDSDGTLPQSTLPALWRAASAVSDTPNLGLRAGAEIDLALNHIAAHLLLASRNLYEGIVANQPLLSTLSERITVELEEYGECFLVRFEHPHGVLPEDRHAVEFTAVVLRGLYGLVSGCSTPLSLAEFRHPGPGSPCEHEQILGCPVRFGRPHDAFLISRRVMLRRSSNYSADLSRRLRDVAEAQLARLSKPSLSERLHDILSTRLRRGPCDADAIAAELHVGVRTLQRRIASEGTSFSAILDQVRREKALELIEGDLTLREIAEKCGFSNPRALVGAFRRWTGGTPSEYRSGSKRRPSSAPAHLSP